MQYHLMSDYYWMMLNQMVQFYQSLFSGRLVTAIIVLVVGIIIAVELAKIVKKVIQKLGIDKTLEAIGLKDFLKKGGIKFSASEVSQWFVKWFIILSALSVAVDQLGLPQATEFLSEILSYLPKLVGALIILTIGFIISRMVYEAIEGVAKATGVRVYSLMAILAKWTILIMAFLVVLEQLLAETSVLQIFAGGLSLMIALAGGIAFGLGGQQHAKELLDEVKNKMSKHG